MLICSHPRNTPPKNSFPPKTEGKESIIDVITLSEKAIDALRAMDDKASIAIAYGIDSYNRRW